METTHNKLQHHFFLFLLIAVSVVMFYIFKPFLAPLIIALSFAVVFRPMYLRILLNVKNRKNIAALISVAIILVVVFLPLVLIGSLLFNEAQGLYTSFSLNDGNIQVANDAVLRLEGFVQRFAPEITIDVARYVQYGLQWTISHLDSFFSGFFRIGIGLFIMILALYYLLRDGRQLREKFITLSPLANNYDDQILNKLKTATNSIIRGSLVIAILQGILAAVGVWIFGLPNVIIWGVCATIASLIPGLGTFIVLGPAVAYLFLSGNITSAIGLLVWAVVVVGLVDNFVTPYLFGRGIKVHSFFILLSVLGGLAFFGPIGFLLGPIILALFFALLDIYPLIIK
ncbi:MAG: AI-2E family transporter [bacterium]|nr:AI-2E family transporter [bacterium]